MQGRNSHHPLVTGLQLMALAVISIALLNYDVIADNYALATFHPGSQMTQILDRLDLTQAAKARLYRTEAQIDDKSSFNSNCQTKPHELELGCYFKGRIYVLSIQNESLAPEMDVVTAHELLHAEWVSMSAGERKRIGDELVNVYQSLGDKELEQRMAGYAQSEPGEEANELHSILGTETPNLPADLEQHYAKYFKNRSQIVAAHQAYETVFTARRAQLESELTQIRAEKGQLAVLNRQMEAYRASGSISAYNALVPQQNRLVDDINAKIDKYRLAVDEYNSLSKSLDSQAITDTESPAE